MQFLVLNGPNLNFLGRREPQIYGTQSYEVLKAFITDAAREAGCEVTIRQSNHEGVLVDWIQEAWGAYDGVILNPAAYTHTSVAILDALRAVNLPAVEVHLSDVGRREAFRRVSYPAMACLASFQGLGFEGYRRAIYFLRDYLLARTGGQPESTSQPL